jgi:hypothetical protein
VLNLETAQIIAPPAWLTLMLHTGSSRALVV